jgi:hypothetical protein
MESRREARELGPQRPVNRRRLAARAPVQRVMPLAAPGDENHTRPVGLAERSVWRAALALVAQVSYPSAIIFLNSSVSTGTTLNRSPTMP